MGKREWKPPPDPLSPLLAERGISKEDLAIRAGCSPSSVRSWSRGYRPARMTRRLADALDIEVEELGE